jgi:hypothetical protein
MQNSSEEVVTVAADNPSVMSGLMGPLPEIVNFDEGVVLDEVEVHNNTNTGSMTRVYVRGESRYIQRGLNTATSTTGAGRTQVEILRTMWASI